MTTEEKKRTGRPAPPVLILILVLAAAVIAAAALLLTRRSGPAPAQTPVPPPADTAPPVISGAHDLKAAVGESISYRAGVTVTDDSGEAVALQIDATEVDLTRPGEYEAVYWAEDAAGNRAEVPVTVTVIETVTVDEEGSGATEDIEDPAAPQATQETVDALADEILAQITTDGMSQYEKALAIYNYVHNNIAYTGTSDKSSWLVGAYVGFTRHSGDCYNYFACSKALLTRAGIPNVDLTRVGGNSRHYWQLVDVGTGYRHFDACPHPNSYPLYSFLLTEAEVRYYTEQCASIRKNYYVYDYDSCPVEVVQGTAPTPDPTPAPTPAATATPEATPALTPAPEVSPSASPDPAETPAASIVPAESSSPDPAESPAASPSDSPDPTESPALSPDPAETTSPLPGESSSPAPAETASPAPAESATPSPAEDVPPETGAPEQQPTEQEEQP